MPSSPSFIPPSNLSRPERRSASRGTKSTAKRDDPSVTPKGLLANLKHSIPAADRICKHAIRDSSGSELGI